MDFVLFWSASQCVLRMYTGATSLVYHTEDNVTPAEKLLWTFAPFPAWLYESQYDGATDCPNTSPLVISAVLMCIIHIIHMIGLIESGGRGGKVLSLSFIYCSIDQVWPHVIVFMVNSLFFPWLEQRMDSLLWKGLDSNRLDDVFLSFVS